MLDFMRSQAQGWIVKVLFAVIVLSFALWGVGDYFSGRSAVTVAEVGEQTIKQRDFQRRVQQQRNRLQQQLGAEMGGRISEQPQFRQRILSQMVRSRLLDQEVARLGLTASDGAVAAQVHQEPAFQRGGEFNAETYRSTLSRMGQTPAKFETSVRRDLALGQLRGLVHEATVVAEPELARAYRARNERRSVRYAALEPASFRDGISMDEAALKDFYQSHTDRYQRPARARVRWVEMSTATYDPAGPGEEELRAYYREHREQFADPAERQARHILIRLGEDAGEEQVAEARARARELMEQARSGTDFAELARKHSQGPSASSGGDLGWFKKGDMVEAFAEQAFAQEPGTISEPVRTRFGFHVIKVAGERGGEAPDFATVRDQVAQQWRQEQGADRLFERLPTFKDLLYTRDNLQAAAEELGLEVRGPVWVPARGELPDNAPGADAFREAALNTQPGRNSEALEVDSTRFVGLHVLEQEPAQTRPFEVVREQVAADYRRAQARERVGQAGEDLRAAAARSSLTAAAQERGIGLQQVGPLQMGQARSELPGDLAGAAFAAEPGKPVLADLPDGGQAVLVVAGVQQPDPAEMGEQERSQLEKQLRRDRGRARLEGYLDQLRERFPVRMRRDVVGDSGSG